MDNNEEIHQQGWTDGYTNRSPKSSHPEYLEHHAIGKKDRDHDLSAKGVKTMKQHLAEEKHEHTRKRMNETLMILGANKPYGKKD